MKPQLESIAIEKGTSSMNVFRRVANGFEPYWHYHPELELTLIEKGSGLRFVGDHVGPFHDGDLMLIGGNLPHQWVSDANNPDEIHVAFVIQFSIEQFDKIPELSILKELLNNSNFGLHFKSPQTKLVEMIKGLEKRSSIGRFIGLIEILNVLNKDYKGKQLSGTSFQVESSMKRHQNRISNVTSYLLRHLDHTITLGDISDANGMSPPSFSRWFKASFGKTFIEYLNFIRIEKACQYILQTDLPITQIAYLVGFESLSNFNRNFLKLKKLSPSTFRKKLDNRYFSSNLTHP